MILPKRNKEILEFGAFVAGICESIRWDECWCEKEHQTSGCRYCETYQLFWGLDPTCGDSGKPEKYYWIGDKKFERTEKELCDLLKLQEEMRKKYK